MLVVETIARIRREYFVKGKPIKEIVRDVKVSRNTVRKVIRSQATAFTYDRRVQPMPKLGPWTAELERMLEANETKSKRERLTLLRISEALEGLGYGGGYDAVRRYATRCSRTGLSGRCSRTSVRPWSAIAGRSTASTGIVKLIECRLFSAFLHEAKLLNLRGGAIDNVPRFRSESG